MMIEKIKNILKLNSTEKQKSVQEEINDMYESLGVDELKIIVGEDLVFLGKELGSKLRELRKKIKNQTGLIIPGVRILDDTEIQENEYQIKIRNNTVFTGYTVPTEEYAINEIVSNFEKECLKNVELVLSNEMTERYMEIVQRNNGWLICYLTRFIPTTGIKIILSDIIKSGKSINDIDFIFEKICEIATKDRDMYTLKDPHKIAKELKCELR